MMDIIRSEILGIKCDAPGCDYRDETPTLDDYPAWLNRPCPKCGANLLTQADLDTARRLMEGVAAVNEMAAILIGKEKLAKAADSGPVWRARVRLNMNGSGKVDPELIDISKAGES